MQWSVCMHRVNVMIKNLLKKQLRGRWVVRNCVKMSNFEMCRDKYKYLHSNVERAMSMGEDSVVETENILHWKSFVM